MLSTLSHVIDQGGHSSLLRSSLLNYAMAVYDWLNPSVFKISL